MQEPTLSLTDDADPAIRDEIGAALVRYNESQVGPYARRPLSVTLRDPTTNAIIGGLAGRTALGMFFIDVLVVPTELQGLGIGGRILGMAEEEARKRGCRTAVLNTANFQAPDFYERYGYRAFGAIEGDPGVTRTFMSKALIQSPSASR